MLLTQKLTVEEVAQTGNGQPRVFNDLYSKRQQLGVRGALMKRPLAPHLGEMKS